MTPSTVSLEEMFAELDARHSTWRWKLSRPFYWARNELSPRQLRRKLRWARQRVRRGYSDLDVWNADHHLARIIPPMMRQLSSELHGVPGNIHARNDGDMDAAVAEWREILEAVAAGFEAWSEIDAEYPTGERLDELQARWRRGSGLLIEYFGAFWD